MDCCFSRVKTDASGRLQPQNIILNRDSATVLYSCQTCWPASTSVSSPNSTFPWREGTWSKVFLERGIIKCSQRLFMFSFMKRAEIRLVRLDCPVSLCFLLHTHISWAPRLLPRCCLTCSQFSSYPLWIYTQRTTVLCQILLEKACVVSVTFGYG